MNSDDYMHALGKRFSFIGRVDGETTPFTWCVGYQAKDRLVRMYGTSAIEAFKKLAKAIEEGRI